MSSPYNFNWSALDRDLLIQFAMLAGPFIIGKKLTPTQITSNFRSTFRWLKVPINFRTSYHTQTEKHWVWVGGSYESLKDKAGHQSITIDLQYSPENNSLKLTSNKFKRMCRTIADTILHEVIHMRQYRRRNFKDIPGYCSTALSGKQRTEQNYLGHFDEIDAYSFNIACYLTDNYEKIGDITTYLNKTDHSDKRRTKTSYGMYMSAFDHNHNHRVIKKLKKRIIYYVPYAKLGKPYKTTDWLK